MSDKEGTTEEDTYMTVISDTSKEKFEAYVKGLEAAGFTFISKNTLDGDDYYSYAKNNRLLYLYYTSRVNEDPIQAWKDHNKDLQERCAYLNSLGIESLHFTAANGTDLTVGMIPEGIFGGGADTSRQGITFNPNIPSEECFTSPMKGKAEGIVYSSMPLSYQGQLIDNFSIRFENGKAVEAKAEKGEELLNTMLTMDEGAGYLGECALVPQASPICQSGILFYNTLFDENAACHLAVGRGFTDCIRDHHNKTLQECQERGINDSMIHVDFMIGCDTMNIDATCADGKVVPIFRNGNWAF